MMANSTITTTYMTSGQYAGQVRFIVTIGSGDPINWGVYIGSKQDHGQGMGGNGDYPYYVTEYHGSNNITFYKRTGEGEILFPGNYAAELALSGIGVVDFDRFDVPTGGGGSGLASITLPSGFSMKVNDVATVHASCKNSSGTAIVCPSLTFSTDNYSIIEIRAVATGDVEVTAMKSGTANLSARDTVTGIQSNNCPVTVTGGIYTLHFKINNGVGGHVDVYKNGSKIGTVQGSTTSTFTFNVGDKYKHVAVPDSGWVFDTVCSSTECNSANPYEADILEAMEVTLTANFGQPVKWDCSGAPNYTCTSRVGGQYNTQADCQAACKSTAKYYNCVSGQCQGPFESGTYSSLSACQAACGGGVGTKYNCVSGQCQGPYQTGQYNSLSECQIACGGGGATKYNCVSGQCQGPYTSGTYNSLSECQAACGGGGGTKYNCVNDECVGPYTSGTYNSLSECQQKCGVDPCLTCDKTKNFCVFGQCINKNNVYIGGALFAGFILLTRK